MSGINDGGPAFPSVLYKHDPVENTAYDGMTLRDYFAGQAVAGLFNHAGWVAIHDGDGDEIAKRSYAIADAMLKARGE